MTNKWEQEVEEILRRSTFDQSTNGICPATDQTISFCALYHPSDKVYWKRLYQHFQVMSRQFCQVHPGWKTDWHIHALDRTILQESQVCADIALAHIAITLFSVDSVMALQESEAVYRCLAEKTTESYRQLLRARVRPPYVKGVLIKSVSWDESRLILNSFRGIYQSIVSSRHHDELYTTIAKQLRACIDETYQFLISS